MWICVDNAWYLWNILNFLVVAASSNSHCFFFGWFYCRCRLWSKINVIESSYLADCSNKFTLPHGRRFVNVVTCAEACFDSQLIVLTLLLLVLMGHFVDCWLFSAFILLVARNMPKFFHKFITQPNAHKKITQYIITSCDLLFIPSCSLCRMYSRNEYDKNEKQRIYEIK